MSKEILILSPIGRIKWLSAPDNLSEILYHLSKTFKIHQMSITLTDSSSCKITPENYSLNLLSDHDLIFQFSYDEVLQRLLESAPPEEEPIRPEPKSELPRDERPIKPRAVDNSWASKPSETQDLIELNPGAKAWVDEPDKSTITSRPSLRANRGKRGTNKAQPEDPRMAEGLKTLQEFGFTDTNKCKIALNKANFNVEQAIEELLR